MFGMFGAGGGKENALGSGAFGLWICVGIKPRQAKERGALDNLPATASGK